MSLYKIKENVGDIELVNARENPELVKEIRAMDFEINDGMVAIWEGKYYYGSDAINLMAMLGADSGIFNSINRFLFRNKTAAASVYPFLVSGRKLALKLLGRRLIA